MRILGLDMGTNSIGWAVVDYERSYASPNGYRETVEQFTLVEKGAHIFKEGVDKDSYGNPQSRAASRTDKRSARRLKFRKKLRKYETLKALIKHGLCPLGIEELEKWRLHKNPVTNKNETFKHYPTDPTFLEWLQTDNQADRDLRKKKIKNPYYFRNKAVTEKITTPYELGRAFYHLAQRRGFASNRLDKADRSVLEIIKPELLNIISETTNYTELYEQLELFFEDRISEDETNDDKILSDLQKRFAKEFKEKKYRFEDCKTFIEYYLNRPENLGPVKKGISDLSREMEAGGEKTLGQLFYNWFQQNRKIRSNYTGREEHYENEFKEICIVQGIDDNSDLYKELYNSIFFQRPLKSQKGLVGKCTLEPNYPRCPVSHPAFEEFRLLKFINNIKIKDADQWRQLVDEEKKKIWEKFFRKSKEQFDFKEIAKLLCKDYPTPKKKDEEPDPGKLFFNYKGNATVTGCPTTANLMDIFGKDWKQSDWADRSWQDILTEPFWKKSLARQCKKKWIKDRKTKIRKGEKGIDLMVNDVWHTLFTYNKESYLNKFAKDYFTDDEKIADKFSSIQLKQEYASFSIKAINNIIPFLREGLIESHSVFLAKLPDLFKNPVAGENRWMTDIELRNQVRTALTDIIDNYQDNKHKQSIVNDLLKTFKDEYGNNDSDYQLDDIDKENIEKKIYSYYGVKSFSDKPLAEQEAIRKWITDNFQKQLQKKSFIKINRLDEEIEEFFLLHPGLGIDEKKVKKLYHPSDIERFKAPVKIIDKDGTPRYYPNSPISGSIKNPTVFRSLFQLRKVISELIRKDIVDRDTRVHIELARELNNMNYRYAIEKWQEDRRKAREQYKIEIKELYFIECGVEIEPTEEEIFKYQCWIEQEKKCFYTGKSISICHFIGPDPKYDIAHTLPRSQTNDNSQLNKTLALKAYNQFQNNRFPSQLPNFSERCELELPGLGLTTCEPINVIVEKWKMKYEELDIRIKRLEKSAAANKQDKNKHDKIIREKHQLTFDRDYWQQKYERFVMEQIPAGFTNRNLVDTGIITRYTQQWLKSYFDNAPVHTIKGEITADFRKIWGLQEEYKRKERINHVHHCIDAITLACITKTKYDLLAHAYRKEEENKVEEAKKILSASKPWITFTEDLKKIESEILVTHQFLDNVPKQTKKKVRAKGKIVSRAIFEKDANGKNKKDEKGKRIIQELIYKTDTRGNRIPVKGKRINKDEWDFVRNKDGDIVYKKEPLYQQGDSVRGSLHKESFYGAIAKDIDGNIRFDEKRKIIPNYVIRKELSKLKKDDVPKIVDIIVRKIITKAVSDRLITFNNNSAIVKGQIWMNEEKKIPIKKVRIYSSVKNPLLDFKAHRDLSKHEYKRQYNVANDENYCMAIYEGQKADGKIDRTCELINMVDAGEYHRLSNRNYKQQYAIVPEKDLATSYKLKVVIRKGQMVLLYNESPEEIWQLSDKEKLERLYEITQLDTEASAIKLLYHQEAREKKKITEFMGLKTGMKGGKNVGKFKEFPWIKIGPKNFDALVEGVDFKITSIGKIEPLKQNA